jgi:hypothetical protein
MISTVENPPHSRLKSDWNVHGLLASRDEGFAGRTVSKPEIDGIALDVRNEVVASLPVAVAGFDFIP